VRSNNNTVIYPNTIVSFIKEHYIKEEDIKMKEILTKTMKSNLKKIITNNNNIVKNALL
jgi:hypothetical protein